MTHSALLESVRLPIPARHQVRFVVVLAMTRTRLIELRLQVRQGGDHRDVEVGPATPGSSVHVSELVDVDATGPILLSIGAEYRGDPPPIGGVYFAHELQDDGSSGEWTPTQIGAFFERPSIGPGGESYLMGVPESEEADLFARRRRLVTRHAPAHAHAPTRVFRHGLYFLELDELTNVARIVDPKLRWAIATAVEALHRRNLRRASFASEGWSAKRLEQDTYWRRHAEAALPLVRDRLRRVLRSTLLTEARLAADSVGTEVEMRAPEDQAERDLVQAIRFAFEDFAIGALHVLSSDIREIDRNAMLVSHGAPNGAAYLLFAEAASVFSLDWVTPDAAERQFWKAMLEIFTDTAEVVCWLFWSGAARTTADYSWNFYKRQRLTAGIWEHRRRATQCIPGRRDGIEDWFSDVTLASLRDHAWAQSSGCTQPPAAEQLRVCQSRRNRPPQAAAYIPCEPPRIESTLFRSNMATLVHLSSPYALCDVIGTGLQALPAATPPEVKAIADAFAALASSAAWSRFDVEPEDASVSHLHRMLDELQQDTNLADALSQVVIHRQGTLAWDYQGGRWKRPEGPENGAWCPFRTKVASDEEWCYWLGFNIATA